MKIVTKSIGVAAAITWFAVSAFAATAPAPPAPSPKDFANGPAQWLMNRGDKAAWRSVKTDAEAQQFIDLFWARRDPTPGTTRNEFREEFESRVSKADQSFATKNTRGALSEKGRVFILLGPPRDFTTLAGKTQDTGGTNSGGSGFGGAHELAAKDTFSYRDPRALGLLGDVIFIQDLRTHEWHYDPQQGNIAGALGMAVDRALINPGLKEVPDWATSKAIAESHYKLVIADAPKAVVAPVIPVQPAGVHTLVLLKDIGTLNPRAPKDPLASATNLDSFTSADDLGYATTICVANYDPANSPTIRFAMSITGESGGKKIRMTAPEDDYTPDAIRSLPGCYLVRGSLPLADVGPGAYKLSVNLTDPTSQQKYNLEQPFKVE
ncbi:MAG: hypothetical protein JWO56_1080 [Acidobacteria bacterium]|nr:hypothetical protein [Acidobacteriota bacterium]